MGEEKSTDTFPREPIRRAKISKKIVIVVSILLLLLCVGGYIWYYYLFVKSKIPSEIEIDGQSSLKFEGDITAAGTVESVIFEGKSYQSNQDCDTALRLYKQAEDIPTTKHKSTLYEYMAECYVKKNNKSQAVTYYDKAINAINDDSEIVPDSRARVKQRLEQAKADIKL